MACLINFTGAKSSTKMTDSVSFYLAAVLMAAAAAPAAFSCRDLVRDSILLIPEPLLPSLLSTLPSRAAPPVSRDSDCWCRRDGLGICRTLELVARTGAVLVVLVRMMLLLEEEPLSSVL